ncbi:MAG: tRNA uridine-5-carboxymethylaminomethyl(34) synthesis enzyme MnmG [Myxococcota bacterium]
MTKSQDGWDVVVVGGGHAGCEAALACARSGLETLLVTGSLDRIAAMSCNPAIGGVGKGHLVKEMDALGGQMPRVADATGIHFRTLNASRGPAVQATRCQSDMRRYAATMTQAVMTCPGLHVRQDDVVGVATEHGHVTGVQTRHGGFVSARRVILTTGTFAGGKLHLGPRQTPGGRMGEAPETGLSDSLRQLGLRLGRLRTGTCPRLDGRTIRTDKLQRQEPQDPAPRFCFEAEPPPLPQVPCHIVHTNPRTHQVIAKAVQQGLAPLCNGQIDGAGPRYCPSIVTKVMRFPHRTGHQVFLEPHGLDTHEVYPAGLGASLPPEVQLEFLRTIEGLEEVHVTRWGYAVEYDFVHPTQLQATLETKNVSGLFCAGQINGTTGYEEAAAQGLIAGLNVVAAHKGLPPLVLPRHLAYIGVLIDDLVTQGTQEPYRMFTSRAEHRLVLREDNVYARLMEIGRERGLVDTGRYEKMQAFEQAVRAEIERLHKTRIAPTQAVRQTLQQINSTPLRAPVTAAELLKRPHVTEQIVARLEPNQEEAATATPRARSRATIEIKYADYIARADKLIKRERDLENVELPPWVFDEQLPGVSNEVFEKLRAVRPRTLGQASRISGVTPAALSLLVVMIRKGKPA